MPAAKSPARKSGSPAPAVQKTQPGSGDATLVYDKRKSRASSTPRLLVTAGPRKGMKHELSENRVSIGRGSDNSLVLPDLSVSRHHARLERQGERWLLVDQGSGNGTRVNGKGVERHALQHGDAIELGDSKVQFVGRPGTRGSPRRRAFLLLGVALVLCLAAVGALRRNERLRLEAEAAAHDDESRAFAQKRFREGVALLKAGKWIEGRDKLKIAAELDEGDAEIGRYLRAAQLEAPRAQGLASARAAVERSDYVSARAELAGIPEDSALSEDGRELARQIRDAMDAAVRDAKARAEARDAVGAQELLDPVLAAEPSRGDALAIQAALVASKRDLPRAAELRRERGLPAPTRADPIAEAYLSGDIGAAIALAQGARGEPAGRRLADLEAFAAAQKEALALREARPDAQALRALERARALDGKISQGRQGRFGPELNKALSALHTQLAAAQAGSEEGLPEAAAHLRAALQADPANGSAQSQLRELADRCKEIYLRGYVEKDEDKEAARRAFSLVVETLPAMDDTAQKAKRWLDKLEGKAGKEE